MDEEEHHTEVQQREASAGGLLAGIFILFLLGIAVMAVFTVWPAIHWPSSPVTVPKDGK
jgi:hypothetical protein